MKMNSNNIFHISLHIILSIFCLWQGYEIDKKVKTLYQLQAELLAAQAELVKLKELQAATALAEQQAASNLSINEILFFIGIFSIFILFSLYTNNSGALSVEAAELPVNIGAATLDECKLIAPETVVNTFNLKSMEVITTKSDSSPIFSEFSFTTMWNDNKLEVLCNTKGHILEVMRQDISSVLNINKEHYQVVCDQLSSNVVKVACESVNHNLITLHGQLRRIIQEEAVAQYCQLHPHFTKVAIKNAISFVDAASTIVSS